MMLSARVNASDDTTGRVTCSATLLRHARALRTGRDYGTAGQPAILPNRCVAGASGSSP